MLVKLSNGYTIEIEPNKIGLIHYTIGDNEKYYIQIIENNCISEIEIPVDEYNRLMRLR